MKATGKLRHLFKFVDDSRWLELGFRCERFLEECWFEFEIDKSPKYQELINKDWSKPAT